ncbi:uncharacterized protein TNIN_239411 [Trichonephila inaurata madagascariensis]|uniref:Uncharacterized protein n=3 Tax=Araneoidea TaxID=74975 RepID=A0A8X6YK31_9ARAC|nr:uncharacterized protein TNIN_239411 [Trichonephila inaurata madagascariensis]
MFSSSVTGTTPRTPLHHVIGSSRVPLLSVHDTMADEPDDDELEAYLRSSLSERRRSRWGRQSLRRGSSPFLTEGMAGKHGRRLSSFTTSSGE